MSHIAREDETGASGSATDDLDHAKDRLRTADADLSLAAARRHPKATVLAAFAVGVVFARIPLARRALWAAGLWSAKNAFGDLRKRKS